MIRKASDVAHVLPALGQTQVISSVIWEPVCLGQISHGDQNKDEQDASDSTAEGKEE